MDNFFLLNHNAQRVFNIQKSEQKNYYADPALYVYWKTESDLTETDKKVQEDRMKKGKLKNANPVLSKK